MHYHTPGQVSSIPNGFGQVDYSQLGAIAPEFQNSLDFYKRRLVQLGYQGDVTIIEGAFSSFKSTPANILKVFDTLENSAKELLKKAHEVSHIGFITNQFLSGRDEFLAATEEVKAVLSSQLAQIANLKSILISKPQSITLPRDEGPALSARLMAFNMLRWSAELAYKTKKFQEANPIMSRTDNERAIFQAIGQATGTLVGSLVLALGEVVNPTISIIPGWFYLVGIGILGIWALPKVASIASAIRR